MSTQGGSSGPGRSLSVLPQDVRDVGNYIYGLVDTLNSALDTATREVDSLTSSGWDGEASRGFATGWDDVRTGGAVMIAALTGMAEKLGVTADTYERRDTANADGFVGSSLELP